MSFNPLAPSVIDAIRALNDQALGRMSEDLKETVRAYVENGLRDGRGPRDIARSIREILPLAPNQLDAVDNFRRMLEDGDTEALQRALRDKRFDGTIEKAFAGDGLSTKQVDSMTDAYQKRMVAFNAETQARTVALDAQKLANHLGWQQQVEAGQVDGGKLTKRWSGTLDDRERDSHLAMEGETVPWDQPYSNGQMQPGDNEYNCRCVSVYSTQAQVKAGAGAQGIPMDALRVASLLQSLRTA